MIAFITKNRLVIRSETPVEHMHLREIFKDLFDAGIEIRNGNEFKIGDTSLVLEAKKDG